MTTFVRAFRAEVIRSAEEVARGFFAFEKERSEQHGGSYHPPLPRLTTDMKLPKFAAAAGHMYAWPPPEKPIDYSLMAGLPLADKPRQPPSNRPRRKTASAHCRSAIL